MSLAIYGNNLDLTSHLLLLSTVQRAFLLMQLLMVEMEACALIRLHRAAAQLCLRHQLTFMTDGGQQACSTSFILYPGFGKPFLTEITQGTEKSPGGGGALCRRALIGGRRL